MASSMPGLNSPLHPVQVRGRSLLFPDNGEQLHSSDLSHTGPLSSQGMAEPSNQQGCAQLSAVVTLIPAPAIGVGKSMRALPFFPPAELATSTLARVGCSCRFVVPTQPRPVDLLIPDLSPGPGEAIGSSQCLSHIVDEPVFLPHLSCSGGKQYGHGHVITFPPPPLGMQ